MDTLMVMLTSNKWLIYDKMTNCISENREFNYVGCKSYCNVIQTKIFLLFLVDVFGYL